MLNQRLLILAILVSFFFVNSNDKESKKPLEHINIFGGYTDKDKDTRLSKYLISRQEKITEQVIDPKKFITSNKVITLEKIPSNK